MEAKGGHVCLLIDFENLVYGLKNKYGEDRLGDEVDINPLLKLAEEYGRVVLANAYADWRSRDINLSVTALSKYFMIFWQSYLLTVLPDQEVVPLKDRRLQLKPAYQTVPSFIHKYEVSVVFKVISKLSTELTGKDVALLLGYKQDNEKSLARCEKILAEATKS